MTSDKPFKALLSTELDCQNIYVLRLQTFGRLRQTKLNSTVVL